MARSARRRGSRRRPLEAAIASPPAPAHAPLVERLQGYAARPAVRLVALVIVLGFFAAHGLVAARTNTPTPDEFAYVPEP